MPEKTSDAEKSPGPRPKIKVLDGVSEGEVGLELHVEQDGGEKPREDITDDDVFKELINIVMDVFSNKSEKCVLTFELPVESNVLKEIRLGNSDVSSSASKSNLEIPIRETKPLKRRRAKRKRKLIELIAKPSKSTKKKKFKKRLNPIIQTVLHSNPGCTDLKKLLMAHRKPDKIHPLSAANRWDAAEKDALIQAASNLNTPQESAGSDNLYNEFQDILQSIADLQKTQIDIPSNELSYHLEEIRRHVEAIRNSRDAPSREIHDVTKSSEAPEKSKVGMKLIRIGAKISRKSSVHVSAAKRKKHNRETHSGLEEILTNYQKVKREETAIVQALLGKLGIHKQKISSKNKKQGRMEPKKSNDSVKTSSPSKDSSKETLTDRVSNPKVKKLARKFEQKRLEPVKNKLRRSRQERNRDGKKQSLERVEAKTRPNLERSVKSSTLLKEIHKEVMAVLRGNEEVKVEHFQEIRPLGGMEEALMHRIQNAAERLEQMHRLVEEKFSLLSQKQQPGDINGEIRTEDCQVQNRLNLSPEVEELVYHPYGGDTLALHGTHETSVTSGPENRTDREENVFEKYQSYVCNYMMELRGREPNQPGKLENQHASEHISKDAFPSTVLKNEFKEDSSSSRAMPARSSLLSSTTNETDGEIVVESLLTSPEVHSTPKPRPSNKKKRVVKANCSLM